jgi:hypothetical protein
VHINEPMISPKIGAKGCQMEIRHWLQKFAKSVDASREVSKTFSPLVRRVRQASDFAASSFRTTTGHAIADTASYRMKLH